MRQGVRRNDLRSELPPMKQHDGTADDDALLLFIMVSFLVSTKGEQV